MRLKVLLLTAAITHAENKNDLHPLATESKLVSLHPDPKRLSPAKRHVCHQPLHISPYS